MSESGGMSFSLYSSSLHPSKPEQGSDEELTASFRPDGTSPPSVENVDEEFFLPSGIVNYWDHTETLRSSTEFPFNPSLTLVDSKKEQVGVWSADTNDSFFSPSCALPALNPGSPSPASSTASSQHNSFSSLSSDSFSSNSSISPKNSSSDVKKNFEGLPSSSAFAF